MHYVFDLLQGLGIAAGVGIRPFLPTLLVGALAAANLGVDFDGTHFSFLEKPAFLIVIVVLVAVLGVVERRRGPELGAGRAGMYVLAAIAVVLAALLASGSIAEGSLQRGSSPSLDFLALRRRTMSPPSPMNRWYRQAGSKERGRG